MEATELQRVHQSWPLCELPRRFDLGCVLSSAVIDILEPANVGELGVHHAGFWECDLSDNSLTWSGGVYDLFGLPRNANIRRDEVIAFYSEGSRAAMERLRSHAIRYGCGFTLDAEICPAVGGRRWMRLIAFPVCEDDRAIRLQGLKLLI